MRLWEASGCWLITGQATSQTTGGCVVGTTGGCVLAPQVAVLLAVSLAGSQYEDRAQKPHALDPIFVRPCQIRGIAAPNRCATVEIPLLISPLDVVLSAPDRIRPTTDLE